MTVLSAWGLRRKAPGLPRSFWIPWGKTGLIYAVGAPLLMSGVALLASDRFGLRWGSLLIVLGPVAYLAVLRFVQSPPAT